MKTRILSVILCLCMVMSIMAPMAVLADGDYADYVPGDMPQNMFKRPTNLNAYGGSGAGVSTQNWGSGNKSVVWKELAVAPATYWAAGKGSSVGGANNVVLDSDGKWLRKDNVYVFTAYVRNESTDITPSLQFAMGTYGSSRYLSAEITNSEYAPVSAVFTATADSSMVTWGFDSSVDRSTKTEEQLGTLSMSVASGTAPYIAEEEIYDLDIICDNDEAELGDTVTVYAMALNQAGLEYSQLDPQFEYYLVNEARDTRIDVTADVSADTKSATITLPDNVEAGTYAIVAEDTSLGITGFRKGVEIALTLPPVEDTVVTDPNTEAHITLSVRGGDTSLNILKDITVDADVVNGTGTEEISWYVLNDTRTIALDDVFALTPSADSNTVVAEPYEDAEDGTYYIVAECLPMRKSVQVTLDSSTIESYIAETIKAGNVDVVKERLSDFTHVLDLAQTYVGKADADDLAKILVNDSQALADAALVADYIETCALVSLYNIPSAEVALADADGNLLYMEELGIDTIDTNGVTLYAAAMNVMGTEGKAKLLADVSGKAFGGREDFLELLKEELLLTAIQYPYEEETTLYVDELLTAANLGLFDIDGSAYFATLNKTQFRREKLCRIEHSLATLAESLANPYESEGYEEEDILFGDYEPGDRPANLLKDANTINSFASGGNGVAGNREQYAGERYVNFVEGAKAASTYWGAGPSYIGSAYFGGITKGKNYVLYINARNPEPQIKEIQYFGLNYAINIAPITFAVTGPEYKDYYTTFTAVKDGKSLAVGFDATIDRSGLTEDTIGHLHLNTETGKELYIAEEVIFDIDLTLDKTTMEAGETVTAEGIVLNQLGREYVNATPEFDYYLVNEARNLVINDVDVTISADTFSAEISTPKTLTPGKYYVIAEELSTGYEDFFKGAEITITKPSIKDTVPGSATDPAIELTLNSGNEALGILEEATYGAQLANFQAGTTVDWYVLNEARTDKMTDSFNLVVSDDTLSVVISPNVNAHEGKHYIVAEADGVIKSMAFSVDKTATYDIITGLVESGDSATLAENMETYIKVLEIHDTFASKADAENLAAVLMGETGENLPEGKEELQEAFTRCALVSLYNIPADGFSLYDENYNFLYEEELRLDELNSNGATLLVSAMESASSQGKAAIQSALTGKGFDSFDEFYNKAKESLLLVAIANPASGGTGYLDLLITEENLALFDIDGSKYFALNDNAQFKSEELRGKTFTIASLESTLASAYETKSADEEDEDEDEDEDDNRRGSSGGGSMSFGGGSSASTKPAEDTRPIDAVSEFVDVPKTHWAHSDIHYLKSLGVINGVSETNFNPEDTVTREQFLKLIIEAFKLSTAGSANTFGDVEAGTWYEKYVGAGVSLGIINGKSPSEFGVGEAVSRQDACVMIDRALSLSSTIAEELSFTDARDISDYAKAGVAALAGYGIVNGIGDRTFAPTAVCTRAQAAKIISSALSVYNSLNLNGR